MTLILRTAAALRGVSQAWQADGAVIGVVPTMGALHEGHLSLVRAARHECDRVIVTIFVNPRQFDNADDLARYPQTEAADMALLAPLHVDAVFAPSRDEVYPAGFASTVMVGGIAERLEGVQRPGHFDGVATVVAKLFGMTGAGRAYFGEKDWQQYQVVRRMSADLDLNVSVVACPTVREPDGLARSSRNGRLSPAARDVAGNLPRVLLETVGVLRGGGAVGGACDAAVAALLAAGFAQVDYLQLCDAETLTPLDNMRHPARLLAAAWVGGVRLIDNFAV